MRTFLRYFSVVLFIGVFGCTTSFLAISKPGSPRVFTSLATSPQDLSLTIKVLTASLHLLINSYIYYAVWLHNATIFLFAQDVRKFIHGKLSTKKQQYSDRHFGQFVFKARALTVLQAEYGSVYRHWVILKELLDIIVMILNIYRAAVMGNYRAMVLVFAVGAIFAWLLQQLAGVYEEWKLVLHSWRKVRRVRKWGRMFLKSCRPVGIPVGSFFYVDRGFMLTVLSIVVYNSASLILAYGH